MARIGKSGKNGARHGAVPNERLRQPCAESRSSAKSAKSAVWCGIQELCGRCVSGVGGRRPADHADGRRTGQGLGPHRLRSPEGGSLDELSFDAVVSRSIGTDGLRSLGDAATPNPLRKRRGLDVLGTGDRGWRPDGLTPGYCLKPFQGFEDGLGKGRESAELMTGVARVWEVWRRDVASPDVIEGLDGGWDVSSQGVLVSKTWECGDETSPPPKSLRVWIGAGTSRPRGCWFRRRGTCGDETSPPPKSVRVWMGAGTSRPRGCWFRRRGSVKTRRLQPRSN